MQDVQIRLSNFSTALEEHQKYLDLAAKCYGYPGDNAPYDIESRRQYTGQLIPEIVTGLKLVDGIKVRELEDLVQWTRDYFNMVYDSQDKSVFGVLFKVYDIVFNSYEIVSNDGSQIAGKNGLWRLLQDFLTEEDIWDSTDADDVNLFIPQFESSLINSKAVFLLCHNPQDEYSDMNKSMIDAIDVKKDIPQLIVRQLDMIIAAREMQLDSQPDLVGFTIKEVEMIKIIASDRIMRDLYLL